MISAWLERTGQFSHRKKRQEPTHRYALTVKFSAKWESNLWGLLAQSHWPVLLALTYCMHSLLLPFVSDMPPRINHHICKPSGCHHHPPSNDPWNDSSLLLYIHSKEIGPTNLCRPRTRGIPPWGKQTYPRSMGGGAMWWQVNSSLDSTEPSSPIYNVEQENP